jgi:hypothetical protein
MEAQIINYKAQVEIGKLIKETSEILSTKAAFQIRYLDTIETILTRNQNSVMMLRTDIDPGTKAISVSPVPVEAVKKVSVNPVEEVKKVLP